MVIRHNASRSETGIYTFCVRKYIFIRQRNDDPAAMVLTSLAAATGPIPDCDFEQGLKNISALSDQLYGSLNTDRWDGFLLQSLLLTNGKTNIMVFWTGRGSIESSSVWSRPASVVTTTRATRYRYWVHYLAQAAVLYHSAETVLYWNHKFL